MHLHHFDPLVAEWFTARFVHPTEPQLQGWPLIAVGQDVLISAPTGSGKTLAAFLICIDQLVRAARAGTLAAETSVVYVSPLKALSNDVHRNLEIPLAEIAALAREKGIPLAPIRTAVRTGDTPTAQRQQMLKQAPHILVTTPESLYILMTAEKSRAILSNARTVIVDEIHAMAGDKRGSHLALTLAREARAQRPLDPEIVATLGRVHLRRGQAEAALELLSQAAGTYPVYQPGYAEVLFHTAMAFDAKRDRESARRTVEVALAVLGDRKPEPGWAAPARGLLARSRPAPAAPKLEPVASTPAPAVPEMTAAATPPDPAATAAPAEPATPAP